MPVSQLVVKTLDGFLEYVKVLEQKWKDSEQGWLWFRGQQRAYWTLTPKLYRDISNPSRETDDDTREQFVIRAPSLTDEKPKNSWEWYFLMQHFGAPTRLLDWTESALIGLYFAVKDNLGYFDAAVWILDPWWLNKTVLRKMEVIPPGASGLSKADEKRYRPWLRDHFEPHSILPERPVAIYPTHFARRISTQRSCFTIHGSQTDALHVLERAPRSRISKVIIPGYAVASLKDELARCGMDEVSIFPDLQGLARVANDNLKAEQSRSMPHDGVYTRLRPSRIHKGGVGVFAIRRIRKGTYIFAGENEEMLWVAEKDLPRRPIQIRKLYDDFTPAKDNWYGCPLSFNRLTPAWYLNDSEDPNVRADRNYDFFALRNIEEGEELTVNSRVYSSHVPNDEAPRAARVHRRPRRV
jgi:hypothetical protein